MTGPLAAAQQLQSLGSERLQSLLNAWRPALEGIKLDALQRVEDAFDLVELLHHPDRLARLLPYLDSEVVAALQGHGTDAGRARASDAALLDPASGQTYPAVATALQQLLTTRGVDAAVAVKAGPEPGLEAAPSPTAGAAAAAAIVRDVVVLAASLSQVAAKRPVDPNRMLRRADQQRLAELIHCEVDAVEPLLRLAAAADLVQCRQSVWRARHSHVHAFAKASPSDRWRRLAAAWSQQFPADVADLAAGGPSVQAGDVWSAAASTAMLDRYPLGHAWIAPMLERAGSEAALLGMVQQGRITALGMLAAQLFRSARDGGDPTAIAADLQSVLDHFLPQEVSQVYLQHDLSIIAPGPLRADLDLRLREFAEPEGHGPASAYRMTTATFAAALRSGVSAAAMRDLLTEISAAPLPQPLEYVLQDLSAGSVIEVREAAVSGAKSELLVADPQRAAELLVDTSLRALRLMRTDEAGRLRSAVAPDVVLNALHSARYPARSAASAPEPYALAIPHAPTSDPLGEAIAAVALRLAERGGPDSVPTEAWHARQLQEAIRSRSLVDVTLAMPNGSMLTLRLAPAAVHNGRLRGRDVSSESERTVPVSSIHTIEVVPSAG